MLAKGYGVKKLGEPAPVNERTLFAIGSSSKAFTAASVAMLVDEGKLKWDDPATKYLPGFEMYDPYVTRELTVRDLLIPPQRTANAAIPLVRQLITTATKSCAALAISSQPGVCGAHSATRTSCSSRPDNSSPK